ncbi:lysine-specific demethylase JMJ31-like isoform X2 [Primulina eburnea]|uniref:lysine-specific demethylase JMJ31-like isoform X2 n=1 Tax=Primulina eburnea TaxID=1245227 RepID=UPI003C6C41C1
MESLQIRRWNEIPPAEEFSCRIEKSNVPAVISGCVRLWKAFSKWDVSNGGLDYLQEMAGSSVVEAMLSKSAPVFYGDIRSHERVQLPFSTFIEYCKNLLQSRHYDNNSFSQSKERKPVGLGSQHGDSPLEDGAPKQIYLAQVPIMNMGKDEKVQLECLREDIETPAFLEGKTLASVNLWMNNDRTRSSTHYDPHHNLLCLISGCKQVTIWPPSATPFLYPFPLYGEASNHSAVPLENPDFRIYPRGKNLDEYSQKVILHAGDALFIPEGWFHQVDSESLTIAVNFWWGSDMISGMLEHMDSYYLRRILKRLTDKEMDQMLCISTDTADRKVINSCGQSTHENSDMNHQTASLKGRNPEKSFMMNELEPLALQSLHELVSLVHDCVKPEGNSSADPSVIQEENEVKKIVYTNLFDLKEDPIANFIWTLEPHTFQNVFLTMAHNFPRTLEAFLLHALSPVGSEVLTKKFEQLDQMIATNEQGQFYQKFYSVFDDQFSAMDAILGQKELFACQMQLAETRSQNPDGLGFESHRLAIYV